MISCRASRTRSASSDALSRSHPTRFGQPLTAEPADRRTRSGRRRYAPPAPAISTPTSPIGLLCDASTAPGRHGRAGRQHRQHGAEQHCPGQREQVPADRTCASPVIGAPPRSTRRAPGRPPSPPGSTSVIAALNLSPGGRNSSGLSQSHPIGQNVPKWTGIAIRAPTRRTASAARTGSRCPGPSDGPQPPTGTSARSTGPASAARSSYRSVSPANHTLGEPSTRYPRAGPAYDDHGSRRPS